MKEKSRWGKRKRKCMALTFVIFMAGTLCACGTKKTIEILNSEDQAQEKEEVTLKEKLQVPEEVEYQFDTGIKFTAEVVIPDCASVGIYEVETLDFTANYMDDFCKNIFDGGKYSILWPSYIYTREELQERYEKVQSVILEWTDDVYHPGFLIQDWLDLMFRLESWQEEWEQYIVSEPGNNLVIYPAPVHDYSEIGEVDENTTYYYSLAYPDYVIAEGTLNDKPARVSFMKAGDLFCDIKVEIERDDRIGYTEYTKERAKTLQMKEAFVYTEETAVGLANEYLESVGMTGYVAVNIAYLAEYDMGHNEDLLAPLNGYRITFGLCKNDVSMLYDVRYRGMITVDIGAEGLIRMYFQTPYMIVSNLSDDTELLAFEQISDVAKSYMSEQGPAIYQSVNRIEFGYMVENYEEGQTLIPVWRYMHDAGTQYSTSAFVINAVDGSMVTPIMTDQMSTVFYN